MSIESFIGLSVAFRQSVDEGQSNPFYMRRIQQQFYELPVQERLNIFRRIDKQLHKGKVLDSEKLADKTPEQQLDIFQTLYRLKLQIDANIFTRRINKGENIGENLYVKATFSECIPVLIALELGNVINIRNHTPHPSPPRPV